MNHKLYDWNDIKTLFCDSIILGNGASTAIVPCFKYDNLYDKSCLSPEVTQVFSK